jgi:hypothetical protein
MWEAIVDTLVDAGVVLNVYWPKLVASLVILVGGWAIARLLKWLIVRGLKIAKLDVVAKKAGIEAFLEKGGMKKTSIDLLAALAYWIALIICLVMVLGIWDIDIGLSNTLVPFLPKVFAALVILILGLFIASIVEDLIRAGAAHSGVKYAYYVGKSVKWVLVVFIVLTAVQQLEIQTEFITWGFLIILASVCLALSLAAGLGAKEVVARKLHGLVDRMETEAQEAAEKVVEDEEADA